MSKQGICDSSVYDKLVKCLTIMRRSKKTELTLIREALELMGYHVSKLRGSEKPDAHAEVTRGGATHRLGIEHTRYHVDVPPDATGGSPGSRLDNVWNEVRKSLFRRLRPRKHQLPVSVHVYMHRDKELPVRESRNFAAELVSLVEKNIPEQDGGVELEIFPNTYPLLRKYCSEVAIDNIAPAVSFDWSCANTSGSWVGVQLDHVVHHVCEKAEKRRNYQQTGMDEIWLIICAEGTPIVSSAGPCLGGVEWTKHDLVAACKSSGFDRILFYERTLQWCQPVWPFGKVYSKAKPTRPNRGKAR